MALDPIQARLTRGDIVLLDGAMGTELERLGVPTALPLWSAQALLDSPDRVRQVHESYVQAGADVITFGHVPHDPAVVEEGGARGGGGSLDHARRGAGQAGARSCGGGP
jgi:S-methylmethionine-dependent homocysteine/selenocysteine methylase